MITPTATQDTLKLPNTVNPAMAEVWEEWQN